MNVPLSLPSGFGQSPDQGDNNSGQVKQRVTGFVEELIGESIDRVGLIIVYFVFL